MNLIIDNIKLIELVEITNSKYGKIKICRDENFERDIYVINGRIVNDKEIINEIEEAAGLKNSDDSKGIVY